MVEPKDVIRKRDPTKTRRDIHVLTLKKVKDFLKEQTEPVFKSEIVRQVGVDYNSLNIALQILNINQDESGKVKMEQKNV